jgi:hypothetical protein
MKFLRYINTVLLFVGLAIACIVNAQEKVITPTIHLVWMGGSDCPPCVAWRRDELPKLEERSEFKSIKFSYVPKVIRSSVPAKFFLPAAVEPLKEKLDIASSGRSGSPQAALIVNGEVYDYFHGTRSADEILRMLASIREGNAYPFARCLKVSTEWKKCEIPG